MKKITRLIFFLFISAISFAQPNLILEKEINFGGLRDNIFAAISAHNNDGGIISGVRVTSEEMFSHVLKFENNTNLIWEYTGVGGTEAWWQSLALAPDGIFLGEGWDTASLLKIDNSGNLVWKKTIGSEAHPILVSNENLLVVVLSTYSACPVLVLDLNGEEIYSWDIQMNMCYGTILDGDNLYILGDNPGGINSNVHSEIIKCDLQGNIVWSDTLMDVQGLRGTIDKNNDLYVSGRFFSNSQSYYRTIKYDLDGNRIWERYYDGDFQAPYNDGNYVNSVNAHPNGGCVVVGDLVKIGGGDPNMLDGGVIAYGPNGEEYFKIRYDANPEWYYTTHKASLFCPDDNCLMIFGSTWNLDPDTAQVLFMTKWDNVVNVEEKNNSIPENFLLFQNYPNPFNPNTTIKYQIPEANIISLKVYDVLGKEIGTLVDKEMVAGSYQIDFDASEYPSGIYFYQINAGDYTETKKMVLLK